MINKHSPTSDTSQVTREVEERIAASARGPCRVDIQVKRTIFPSGSFIDTAINKRQLVR